MKLHLPEVGLLLLFSELVQRLFTEPEGGVQAVDLDKERVLVLAMYVIYSNKRSSEIYTSKTHRISSYYFTYLTTQTEGKM